MVAGLGRFCTGYTCSILFLLTRASNKVHNVSVIKNYSCNLHNPICKCSYVLRQIKCWCSNHFDDLSIKRFQVKSILQPFHIDWINFQKMLTLYPNRVNFGHTLYKLFRDIEELNYSVCPAQKWPQMPQNPIYDHHRQTEMYLCTLYFILSKAETRMKCAFACFHIWEIQCHMQCWAKMWTHNYCKKCLFNYE